MISSRDQRTLVIGALAVVAMLGYAKLWRPMVAETSARMATLGQQSSLVQRERELLAGMSTLPRERETLRRAMQESRDRLFNGDSIAAVAALATYVSDVARATGTRLGSVEARPVSHVGGLTTLAVELHGEATWRQAVGFIRALESAGPLIDVRELRLETGARGGPLGGDLVSITGTVSGYSAGAP
ncbi:MAG: GspMb/PilO family protein [Gemmatimonadaceae bacterium]